MRIYEFSKLHNLATKDVLEFLQTQGVDCKSHMAVITQEALVLLEKKYLNKADLSSASKKENIVTPSSTSSSSSSQQSSVSSSRKERSPMHEPQVKKVLPKKTFEKSFIESSFVKPLQEEKSVFVGPLVLQPVTVGDFAVLTGKPVSEIIVSLLKLGAMCTKNHLLSIEQVAALAQVYGYETTKNSAQKQQDTSSDSLRVATVGKERLPIVVVMGHVDHGKTTLLDYIRKTRVASREKGGITQHLGAYEAQTPQGNIVFLDTPGHEAFSKVRRRGAFIADIAVLVIAADDGVMPQTIECIKALKELEIPIIVAINKVDKVEKTRLEVIKRQLSQYDLVPEEWGGNVICTPISGKEGTGVDELLELIILQSQMMELQGNLDQPAEGYVLEAKLEKGRGSVATVICRHGTLSVGDFFSVGDTYGKVISLKDSAGVLRENVGPSVPVVVTGFDSLPDVGTFFKVIDEKDYRRLKSSREDSPLLSSRRSVHTTRSAASGVLNLVVKTEGNASLEAVLDGVEKLSKKTEKPFFIVHSGVGNISENDMIVAENAGAYVVGFGVKADLNAVLYGRKAKIDIQLFDIIYRLFEDLEKYAKKHEEVKKILTKIGEATVLKVFVVKKFGVVAGAYIREGRFSDKGITTIWRGKKVVGQGKIKSLQRDKKNVKEVHTGFECAFLIEGFEDWQVDDRVECFLEVQA